MKPVFITEQSIAEANHRHDLEHGDPFNWNRSRTRPGWNPAGLMRGAALTDRKIDKYAQAGWYSEDFKKKRLLWNAKKHGQRRREGNFDLIDGRLIYRP